MSEGRVARFRVRTHLNGQNEATVELTEKAGGEDFVVSVRALHSRIEYRSLLSDVAQIVASRHVKVLAAAQGINVPKAGARRR